MKDEALEKNEYTVAIINQILIFALGIILSVITTRYLGPELKGRTAYIIGVVETSSTALTLGLHHAYSYYRRQYGRENYGGIFYTMIVTMYGLLAIVFCVLAVIIPVSQDVKFSILLTPLFSYTRVLGGMYLIESPKKKYKTVLMCRVLEVVYAGAVAIFIGRNIVVAVTLIGAVMLFQGILYSIWGYNEFGIVKSIRFRHYFEAIKYGLFPMISLLLSNLNYKIDIIMLGNGGYVSLVDIGIYSLGVQLSERVGLLTGTVHEVLLSHLTKKSEADEVALAIRVCLGISVFLGAMLILFGRPLLNILYGSEYIQSYRILCLYVISPIALIVYEMIAQYNIVTSKQRLTAYFLLVGLCSNIIINIIMVPVWGIMGAAVGTITGDVLCATVFLLYFTRKTKIRILDVLIVKRVDLEKVVNSIKSVIF